MSAGGYSDDPSGDGHGRRSLVRSSHRGPSADPGRHRESDRKLAVASNAGGRKRNAPHPSPIRDRGAAANLGSIGKKITPLMRKSISSIGCSKRPASKAAGKTKPETYSLEYVEDFVEPRT